MNVERSTASGINWFKSTHSAGDGGECVEIAATEQAVLVRDSKDVSRPHLAVGRTSWTYFVRYAAGA